MNAVEARIWRAFLQSNAHLLTGVMHNVHVGTVAGDVLTDTDDERRLRAALYAKRIDALGLRPHQTWLIEVKEHVRPSALGQLLVYIPLLAQRFPALPPARPVLVAATFDADTAAACVALKITCTAPPFTPLTG